jgi:hypothetical protein
MAQPSRTDVHPVDPVLSNYAQAYINDEMSFVASRAIPWEPVDSAGGTFITYTKGFWFSDEVEERAYGGDYPMAGYGLSSSTYKTLQYALAHPIPDETEAASQTPMSLRQAGIRFLSSKFLIRRERAFASEFMNTSNWTTNSSGGDSGFTKWSDTAGSDPIGNIRTCIRTVQQLIGRAPNTAIMGQIVWDKLIEHPDVIDRVKYTQTANSVNIMQAIAGITEIPNWYVSRAVYNSAIEGQDASLSAIIDDDILFAYVNPNNAPMDPTGGKVFFWEPGGGQGGIREYYDDEKDAQMLKWKEQWDMKVVGADAGYILDDIVD